MLRQDKELEDYMTSNSILSKEIKFRDKNFKEGKLQWCELKEIQGFITRVIISNSYYLLKKNATHNKVIEKLKCY